MKFADMKKRICVFLKKCLFYAREVGFHRSYSQYGEDILLQGFLEDKWSWSYKGFWVDIGAHHPSNLSNTKAFSLNGWRGINVDASSDAIAKFNRHRKRDVNVNVGIGLESGILDYYRMSSSPRAGLTRRSCWTRRMPTANPPTVSICVVWQRINCD